MMKKVNAFTLIETLIVIATVGILAALLIPAFVNGRDQAARQKNAETAFRIGDMVYLDSLSVTGVINRTVIGADWQRVTIIVKSMNGTLSTLEDVDAHLIKKVPPSPEEQWKR